MLPALHLLSAWEDLGLQHRMLPSMASPRDGKLLEAVLPSVLHTALATAHSICGSQCSLQGGWICYIYSMGRN